MAEISRRAGVGMATLYRNFPGRRELLEALYTDEVDAICTAAAADGDESPATTLIAWLGQVYAFFHSKRQVGAELLKHSERGNFFSESRDRVLAAGRPLLIAAQRGGEIRADLTLEQILDMTHAIATIDSDPEYVQPILQAAIDGLRSVKPRST